MPHRRIAQDFLDRQTNAFVEHDLDAFLETVAPSYRRLSLTHDSLVETTAQARMSFDAYSRYIQAGHVNTFYRQSHSVRQLSDRYIEMIYVSHLLKNAAHAVPPFEGRTVIARENDEWRMIESERQLNTLGLTADIMSSIRDDLDPLTFSIQDIRKTGSDPLQTYQAHIDGLTQAERDNDFERFVDTARLPYSVHYQRFDDVIDSPEIMRTFFATMRRMHNGEVGDHLERQAYRAEFVGADMLVGYHKSHVYKDDTQVTQPVSSRMILQHNGTRWKLISVANAITNTTYAFDMHHPTDELMTDIDIQKRTQEWPSFQKRRM